MYKFSSNNFQKGLNQDFDSRIVPENTYRNAINVTLVRSNEFLSLSVIGGSQILAVFDTDATENVSILGNYECNLDSGKGVVVFYKGENTFGEKFNGIKLIEFSTNTAYDIAKGLWLNFDEVTYVDGVIDTDNGYDVLYFMDNVNPPRHINCLTNTLIVPKSL